MLKAKKVIIADDHPLFRDALSQAVTGAFGDIEVISCGAFSTLQRSIESHGDSDLILLDLHMPGAVGFSALRYLGLRCPNIPVAIISAHEEPEIVLQAIKHGASGFIAKSSPLAGIIESVQNVLMGDVVLPEGIDISKAAMNAPAKEDLHEKIQRLTPKQFRVLMMLIDGRINREIADELCVTEATIKAHLTEIFKKLEVSNRTQAATVAAAYLEVEEPTISY
ncbi:response regulator transcription factor [Leucothrix arctica]|uniref:DNA-binding response regulator n=1 Tax=Leucothrix arctica TaxID=1481894 RepID=A0A317CIN0_9GAMM|nr:response regulator transcription factor [Leucothrix arctica]PWQ98127.1 DNA-binding response regulator [Leucothrix arctica]